MNQQSNFVANAVRSMKNSPNAFYNIIAIFCVLLVLVEVIGYLKGDGVKIAILFGIAMLALLLPNIESLTLTKEGVAASIRKDIKENTDKIVDTKNAAREIDEQLSQNMAQIIAELRELRELRDRLAPSLEGAPESAVEGAIESAAGPWSSGRFRLPPVKWPEDPQKDRFGGKEESNGRRLTAEVEASSLNSEWRKVTLKVSAIPGAPPLSGKVQFYLHDSFSPDQFTVQTTKLGEAIVVVRSWGAFTVGAVADEGNTLLELDLATSPNVIAPKDWRER